MKLLSFLFVILIALACSSNSGEKTTNDEAFGSASVITVDLKVGGMTCEGCETTISKMVGDLEGVEEVTASYIDSVATVRFDSSLVTLATISNTIHEVGYEVVE